MALMRLIRDAGATKDHPFFSLKSLDFEMENMKQIIKEKDVVIDNNNEKIKELENYVSELKEKCSNLQNQLKSVTAKENEKLKETVKKLESYCQMPEIVSNYENLLKVMSENYETIKNERAVANAHLGNLKSSFTDLVSRYDKLKGVLKGYQENQDVLLDQISMYKEAVTQLEDRYESFKKYANEKLSEANAHVEKIDKKHISELAKVKTKVLQSKVKINELQKTISILSDLNARGDTEQKIEKPTPFLPLSTNFTCN